MSIRMFGRDYHKVVLIEPHADDLVISMGATLLKYLNHPDTSILTITSPSIYNAEISNNLAKYLQIKNFQNFQYKDIPFRVKTMKAIKEQLGVNYSVENAFKLYNDARGFDEVINYLIADNPDVIFLPMGIQHLTHIYVREKLSNINKDIIYYRDEPYASKKKNQPYLNQLLQMVELVGETEVDESLMKEKLFIFKKVYPSQWYFISAIKEIKVERFYRLKHG